MRVLICGGHRNVDPAKVCAWLERDLITRLSLHFGRPVKVDTIIHGKATGADHGGAIFGLKRNLRVIGFAADWERHGNSAGPIRNRQMLIEGLPDAVVAFPGSRGTADMVRRARNAGVPTFIVEGDFS